MKLLKIALLTAPLVLSGCSFNLDEFFDGKPVEETPVGQTQNEEQPSNEGNSNQNTNPNENQNTGGNENQSTGGNENQSTGGNENQSTGGNENQSTGGNENQSTGGNENQSTGGNENQSTGGNENQNTGENGNTTEGGNENNGGEGENQNTGTETPPVIPTTEEELNGFISRIYFKDAYKVVNVDKYEYLTPEIVYLDGYSFENTDETYTWSVEDSSVATITQVGKVTGVKKGSTIVTIESGTDHLKASIKILVTASESDIVKTWERMGAGDKIEEKDSIIIACPEENKAAGTSDLHSHLSSVSITFSADKSKITNVANAAQFYVYSDQKSRPGYNFELLNGEEELYLATTNTNVVHYYNTTNSSATTWDVYWDNEYSLWDMRSATTVDGWMMYNKKEDCFSTYQSNPTDMMFVVTLYRLTYTINV